MSDTTTLRAPDGARHRNPAGGVRVGDYVGQPAAQAALAVRRIGLRPGLDRSFGCEPQLTGLIIAQEPAAGEQRSRNAMVTLYVAAAAVQREQHSEQPDAELPSAHEHTHEAPAPAAIGPRATGRPRSRKRSRARPGAQQRLDLALEPTLAVVGARDISEPRTPAQVHGGEPEAQPPAFAAQTLGVPEAADRELPYEARLARRVFAVGGGSAQSSADAPPAGELARIWRAALSRARRRRMLSASLCAMLSVWVALAFAGALRGPQAQSPAEHTPTPAGTAPARRENRRPAAQSHTDPARVRLKAHPGARHPQRARMAREVHHEVPASENAQPETQGEAAAVPRPATQPATATPAPSAQSAGGPFSP